MFGKLLKYDFRSMLKQFAFIWPAALGLALVNRFTLNSFVTSVSETRQTISGIAMVVYIAVLIAMFVIALIFTIQRFSKGLLGDEGYLMHTLPVRPWQLIGSKLLCVVITTFLSVVVALLSVLVLVPWKMEDFQEIFKGLGYIFRHWNTQAFHGILAVLELCLVMMMSFAVGYLQIYLALSIGHLFNKNRTVMSVIAFILVNTVVNALGARVLMPFFERISNVIDGLSGAAGFHSIMWIIISGALVLCAIYFAGTEFILRRKLNLE